MPKGFRQKSVVKVRRLVRRLESQAKKVGKFNIYGANRKGMSKFSEEEGEGFDWGYVAAPAISGLGGYIISSLLEGKPVSKKSLLTAMFTALAGLGGYAGTKLLLRSNSF